VTRKDAGPKPALVWLDALKGVALLWIVLNHVVEQIAGGEFVGNPDAHWPPLGARVAQFFAPAGAGATGAIATIVRDIGWLGDQGVTLFLIASGFGLAYGLNARGIGRIDLGSFYRARAARVYPLWLGAHAVLFVCLYLTWSKIGAGFLLSALGIRFLPQTIYAFVPAWWYVGLLLQLYAIAPLLWAALRRFGPWPVLAWSCAIGFIARAAGLFTLHGFVDPWSRGAIFVTRVPEFALGMCFALLYAADPETAVRALRRPASVLAAVATFCAGLGCAFTLLGMAVAPFLMGAGAFALLVAALHGGRTPRALAWTGRNSYALYLVHQPFVEAFVPPAGAPLAIAWEGIAAALASTFAAARALEIAVGAVTSAFARAARKSPFAVAGAGIVVVVACYLVLVVADVAAARVSPQEINGWGERPSLMPAADVGWKLVPSKTTHLRWVGYDYTVRANALGFPGPDVDAKKPPDTLRVLVTGDAFTSGEGVGTRAAWPALLQDELARDGRRNVQVLNFGITGYGPDQEARVLREYVPRFKPDVVILESFVNAFEKLGESDDDIRREIGFGQPGSGSASATLRLSHLRLALAIAVLGPLQEWVTGRTDPSDVGLSDASAFLAPDPANAGEVAAYEQRVREARDVARGAGASFLLVMIPSRAQVCSPADYRRGALVDLSSPPYDRDRPQREAAATARRLGVAFLDLRSALKANGCDYQRQNMHWLEAGDAVAARAVANEVRTRIAATR